MIKLSLLPARFRIIGLWLSPIFFVLGILCIHAEFQLDYLALGEREFLDPDKNLTDEFVGVGFLLSLILAGFSKLKTEDEYSASLRLKSLVQSLYLNAALLLVALLFFYSFEFLNALIYVAFSPFIFHVILFHLKLARDEK